MAKTRSGGSKRHRGGRQRKSTTAPLHVTSAAATAPSRAVSWSNVVKGPPQSDSKTSSNQSDQSGTLQPVDFSMSKVQNQSEFPPLPNNDSPKMGSDNEVTNGSITTKYSINTGGDVAVLSQQDVANVPSVKALAPSGGKEIPNDFKSAVLSGEALMNPMGTLPFQIAHNTCRTTQSDPSTSKVMQTLSEPGKQINGHTSGQTEEPGLSVIAARSALPMAHSKDIYEDNSNPGQVGFRGLQHLKKTITAYNLFLQGTDPKNLGIRFNTREKIATQLHMLCDPAPPNPRGSGYTIPESYNVANIQNLALVVPRFKVSVLMYMFYAFPNDVKQILAGWELFQRNWRWHIKRQIWLTTSDKLPKAQKLSDHHEQGWYMFWNTEIWGADKISTLVFYADLESNPPRIPEPLVK